MLGWSSEAGNPNIQALKEKLAKAEREKQKPRGHWVESIEIQTSEAIEKIGH